MGLTYARTPWLLVALGAAGCGHNPSAAEREDAQVLAADASASASASASEDAAEDAASPGRYDAGVADAGRSAFDATTQLSDAATMDAGDSSTDAGDAGFIVDRDGAPDEGDAKTPYFGPRYESAILSAPPSYLGNSGSGTTCGTRYRTIGSAPVDVSAAQHPLFLYFVGTSGSSSDASARFDAQAPRAETAAMARRGFVALSVEYDNSLAAIFTSKFACLFGTSAAESVLAKACALPSVDCSLGIATWGHSQGALLAHAVHDYDARVRATWATGYGGVDGFSLPVERLRVVNAENDTMNGSVTTLNKASGRDVVSCPDDGRNQCLRADGSGWIRVLKADCQVSAADHCWFNKSACTDNAETLEPNWADSASTKAFALELNADWVAATVARP